MRYEGGLRTLHARRDLDLPAAHKGLPNQPGYRVRLDGIEVGAPVSIAPISPRGRSMRRSRARGAADDLRQTRRAGGQTPPRVFALIWNLHLESLRRRLSTQPFCTNVFSSRLEGFGRDAGEQTHPAAPDDPHRQDGNVLWASLSCILLVRLENFLQIRRFALPSISRTIRPVMRPAFKSE